MKVEIKLPMIYHANNSKDNEFPHQILAVDARKLIDTLVSKNQQT